MHLAEGLRVSYLGGNGKGRNLSRSGWAYPNWGNYCGSKYGDDTYKTACYDEMDLGCARHDTCHDFSGYRGSDLDNKNICNLMVYANARHATYLKKGAKQYIRIMESLYTGPNSTFTLIHLSKVDRSERLYIDTGRTYNQRPSGLPSSMHWGEAERNALAFAYDIGRVKVTQHDLIMWMVIRHLGYRWNVVGDHTFTLGGDYSSQEKLIENLLNGREILSEITATFKFAEDITELKPNQAKPFEDRSRSTGFKAYDPTYLNNRSTSWY